MGKLISDVDKFLNDLKDLLSTIIKITGIALLLIYILNYQITEIWELLNRIQHYCFGQDIFSNISNSLSYTYIKDESIDNTPIIDKDVLKALVTILTYRMIILSGSVGLLLFLLKKEKDTKSIIRDSLTPSTNN